MIFIADPSTKKFSIMIRPFTILRAVDCDTLLYVQDYGGSWYSLDFEDVPTLAKMVNDLRDDGRSVAFCSYSQIDFCEINVNDYDDQEREIDYDYERFL